MSKEGSRSKLIRRMTELLRSGAIMLDQACPLCGSPLFKLRSGEIVCPIHGPVKVVKTEREAVEVTTNAVLDEVEKVFTEKALEILRRMRSPDIEPESEVNLVKSLIYWLDVLERVRRIKSSTKK